MSLIDKNGLKINSVLYEFINKEAIPGTNINAENFWNSFEKVVHKLAPINKSLIKKRESIQIKIDEWHKNNIGKKIYKNEYTKFLKTISYLVEEKESFEIETSNVDKKASMLDLNLLFQLIMLGMHLMLLMLDGEVYMTLYTGQM